MPDGLLRKHKAARRFSLAWEPAGGLFCFVQRSRALLEAIQSLYKNSTSWWENSI